jgi:Uma2 family endonuclease
MPGIPRDQRFEVAPNWVCEILSPSTESKDRQIKMPIYAHYGVGFAWLIDPLKQTLEAFVLDGDSWSPIGAWRGGDSVAVAPFEGVPLALGSLWA